LIVYPNKQDAAYEDGLPAGWSNRAVSISGGYLKWPKRWTTEQILAVGQSEIRQALKNHFPDPGRYAGMKILLDLEGDPNPGSQRDASPQLEQDIADAADLRIIEAGRHFPNSAEIYLWCARNAQQNKANIDDFGDVGSLVHMAKRGMLMGAAGIVMGCYPTCTSDENRTKFEKCGEAIDTAVTMGHAIVRAAKTVDGADRRIMVQSSLEAWGEARTALPAKDVRFLLDEAESAGVEEFGLWSGRDALAGGESATELMSSAAAMSMGSGGGV
jgi:hypothetical protein